jgi:hypothetical protein
MVLPLVAADLSGAGILRGSAMQWLPFLDTFRTMCLAPEPEFRQLLEGIRGAGLADLSYVA